MHKVYLYTLYAMHVDRNLIRTEAQGQHQRCAIRSPRPGPRMLMCPEGQRLLAACVFLLDLGVGDLPSRIQNEL